VKNQLDRAATSIVLNIAEGAGEFCVDEKQRFYRMARRSSTATAAILTILKRRRTISDELLDATRAQLVVVVAMRERARAGAGAGAGVATQARQYTSRS
jgi:four helix bundle protein